MTRALTEGLTVTSDKETLVLKRKTTILKIQEHLDHGNNGGYILAAKLYTSPNDAGKTDKEGKNLEGKTNKNMEELKRNTATKTIK